MQIYKVGGCVRDRILGLTPTDTDYLVIGSTIDEMLAAGYCQVGKDFPVFLHPDTKDEYALARTEKKTGNGYKGFSVEFGPEVSLADDLKRRDLTINSIAVDDSGNVIDPLNCMPDIENKILRHTSSAFVEDPVRVLRVARFYARYYSLGFVVAPETIELMKLISSGTELSHLTKERITKELLSALSTTNPEKFFELLHETGALKHILPELDILWGIPQTELYHPEIDTGIHTMMVLQQACKFTDDVATRLAAVFHDLGKGVTPSENWPSHHKHELLGVSLIKNISLRLGLPKEYNVLCQLVSEFHLNMHRLDILTPRTIVDMMQAIDIYRKPNRIQQFAIACKSDALGRKGMENNKYINEDMFLEMAQVLRSIDISALLTQGLSVDKLKGQIHLLRINAIKNYKRNLNNGHSI